MVVGGGPNPPVSDRRGSADGAEGDGVGLCCVRWVRLRMCHWRRWAVRAMVRSRSAARRFLRRLVEIATRKPLRLTTDQHPAYGKAIRWILGRKVLHRQSQYLNNRIEQNHRAIKQRYYPMLGFGQMESATRFCSAFEELRQYLRIRSHPGERVSLSERRRIFRARWQDLMTEMAAA